MSYHHIINFRYLDVKQNDICSLKMFPVLLCKIIGEVKVAVQGIKMEPITFHACMNT